MGNSQSGHIVQLQDALKKNSVIEQELRKQIHAQEQVSGDKDVSIQNLREQINVRDRYVVAALLGGGTLLLAYIIKKRFFSSETPYLLHDPWRTIHQTETDISKIKDFYLRKIVDIYYDQDTKLNILLLGQAASGKSSFVNSCKTGLRQTGTISTIATVLEGCSHSVSRHLLAYGVKVQDGDGKLRLPVRLFDCRGLLDDKTGVQTEDIISICNGHVKDKYEIQPETPISPDDPKYRVNPGEKDKIHCVVYVIDAQNGNNFVHKRVKEQFEEVKKHLLKPSISTPQLILLTKIDQLGVRQMDKIFYDKRVEECCEKASSFLGFPMCNVLPQANYSKEATPTEEKDCITLFNIWTIMERAKDYVQRTSDETESVPM